MPRQPAQASPAKKHTRFWRWLAHGTLWAFITLTTYLGFWQWQRAQAKSQLIAQHTARQKQAISHQAHLFAQPQARFRRVQLNGHFDTAHPVWQASQFHHHQVGYNIWLPFLPAKPNPHHDHPRWLWVNMGWVPQNLAHAAWQKPDALQTSQALQHTQHKIILPALPRAAQPTTALGIVDALPHTHIWGIRNNSLHPRWPLISVQPNWEQAAMALHRDFYPLSWRITTPQPGWEREHHWVTLPPSRHKAYAAQWLAMALVLLILWYRYWRYKRND